MDLALLLSITPASYSLTLDECRDAGVPVIAFDHGAIAERVHALEGGLLVPPEAGADGVVAALREVLDGRPCPPPAPIPDETARVGDVARAHLRLYREPGVL